MAFRRWAYAFAVVVLSVFVSCTSVQRAKRITGQALMYGMVYNSENIPVTGADVSVDGKVITVTDVQGRFVLVSKQRKEFTLLLAKPGYESVEGVFRFEPMEVIHLVMLNADELVQRAERAMNEDRYHDVGTLCDRALALHQNRIDASYLKALSLIRLKEYDCARLILLELQNRLGERDYLRTVLKDLGQ